jgi:predicted MFS family arabinose efflux permease
MTAPTSEHVSFRRLIGVGMAAKFIVDIGAQIFNPFLPIFAAGMGIDVITLGRLLGLRSAMGLLAPVAGVLADRTSYRRVLRGALLLGAAGYFLLAASTNIWIITVALLLTGIGGSSFVPTLQAYVSARLPYTIRARGLGMIEYAWALTGIIGLPLVGLLLQYVSWQAPLILLGAGMVVMAFVFGAMPAARHNRPAGSRPRSSLAGFFRLSSNSRSAYSAILAAALSYFAAMQLMIAHGVWLQAEYGLSAAELGAVAFVLGFFDLAASVSVSLFTDRIGKRRSVLIGIVGSLAGYIVMPFFNVGVVAATLAIAVTRMFFEFNIVSHFPLLSQQSPPERGKLMTLGAAVSLVGATVAGFSGPWLYLTFGVRGLSVVSAVAVAVALVLVVTLVNEGAAE